MTVPDMTVQADQRACFFGRTGSGKTTLAMRVLMSSAAQWVALDPKEGLSPRLAPGVRVARKFDPNLPRQIIRLPERLDVPEAYFWQAIIWQVWRKKGRLIYADELTLINPGTRLLAPALGRAIRTGRERGVPVWSASQRPTDIPSAVFTETEHFFVFQLTYQRDRDKVASFTGDSVADKLTQLRGHDFVYYNVLEDRALLVRQ